MINSYLRKHESIVVQETLLYGGVNETRRGLILPGHFKPNYPAEWNRFIVNNTY